MCPDAPGTAGDEWDGVERAIIERILRSAAAQGGRELPSIGDSTPPGATGTRRAGALGSA